MEAAHTHAPRGLLVPFCPICFPTQKPTPVYIPALCGEHALDPRFRRGRGLVHYFLVCWAKLQKNSPNPR